MSECDRVRSSLSAWIDGELSIDHDVVEVLQLPWRQKAALILADGSSCIVDRYDAIMEWDGRPRRVVVDCTDGDDLLGMGLLRGFRLTLDATPGGAVIITPLS